MKVTRNGDQEHIAERRDCASTTFLKLYRFKHMPVKLRIQLVNTLVFSILDYPPISILTLSKTQISKLLQIQNKTLRFATDQRHPYTLTTEQIHTLTKILPINQRLHLKAERIWHRIEQL